MILEIIVTGVVGVLIGLIIALPLYKKTKILERLKDRAMFKTINDPELLKKRLEENEIYETVQGGPTNRLKPVIIEKDGKKQLEILKEPLIIENKDLTPLKKRTKSKNQASESLKRQPTFPQDKEDLDRQDTNPFILEELEENEKEVKEDGRI